MCFYASGKITRTSRLNSHGRRVYEPHNYNLLLIDHKSDIDSGCVTDLRCHFFCLLLVLQLINRFIDTSA